MPASERSITYAAGIAGASAQAGVGLALTQQIARAHGGEIQLVNRKDGEGARATIRLPISADESTPA